MTILTPMEEWIRTHARRSDPATSHAAAKQARSLASEHHSAIMACMADGVTRSAEQIGDAVDLTMVQVARRVPELVAAGDLERVGTARNRNGRLASTYRKARRG